MPLTKVKKSALRMANDCATDASCCNVSTANVLRVVAPAAVAYGAGEAAEAATAAAISACACCSCWSTGMTALTVALIGGCIRTHIPVIYQLDIHRKFWRAAAEKYGLGIEETAPIINNTESDTSTKIISTQPQEINAQIPAEAAIAPSEKESKCVKIPTRAIASFAPGFAFSTMPAALSVYCPGSETFTDILKSPELANATQAVVPSACGFWHENRDVREARQHTVDVNAAFEAGKQSAISIQPRA